MCDGMAWMGLIVIPSNLTQPVSFYKFCFHSFAGYFVSCASLSWADVHKKHLNYNFRIIGEEDEVK